MAEEQKREKYRVLYRPDNAQADFEIVDLAGCSKADVLRDLENRTTVYHIIGVERVKND